jgi:signal peptidase I
MAEAEAGRTHEGRRWLNRGLLVVAWLLLSGVGASVMVWQVEHVALKPYRIPSSAMEPTLRCARPATGCEGDTHDRIFVMRFHPFWTPSRGDIVAFRTTPAVKKKCFASGTFVKRIVGLPGETLRLRLVRGREYVHVNGHKLDEPYVQPDRRAFGPAKTWRISKDEFFLLGDNRSSSCDSRHWGPLPRGNIVGKVAAVYWPLDRIGSP